ncbi:MAG: hypothetical protein IBX71_03180 [Candidatus Desulforudis sp.]|nr:hypothetical protein [Desulforudis sp.]
MGRGFGLQPLIDRTKKQDRDQEFSGNVHWLLGGALAAGNAAGAYLGGVFVVSKGDKWIRVFLVASVVLMAGKLLEVHTLLGF